MNAGSIMADIFAELLLGSGLYEVVEQKKVVRLRQDFDIDASNLFIMDNMNRLQQVLNIDGLVLGVVMEMETGAGASIGAGWSVSAPGWSSSATVR
jgi:hypothetical protein